MADTYTNTDPNALTDQLHEYLIDVEYKATKQDLITAAEDAGANIEFLVLLEQLPEKEYTSWDDVMVAMGDYNLA